MMMIKNIFLLLTLLLVVFSLTQVHFRQNRNLASSSEDDNFPPDWLLANYNMTTTQGKKKALELYMYLHNELGRIKWLPLDLNFGQVRGEVITRYILDNHFLPMVKQRYNLQGPKCIEWAKPQYIVGNGVFRDICTEPYVIEYDKQKCGGKWGPFQTDQHRRNTKFSGFCADIHTSGGVIPDNFIDLVVATQVFEHLYDPFTAAQNIYNLTRPGGVLILTVPQISIFHGVPNHYFGYTVQGIAVVLQRAGFCLEQLGGIESSFTCISHLLGFSLKDIYEDALYEKDDITPCNIGVVARKPKIGEICQEKLVDANRLNKFRKSWGKRIEKEMNNIE